MSSRRVDDQGMKSLEVQVKRMHLILSADEAIDSLKTRQPTISLARWQVTI